jgi:hypothetical protein
MLIKRARTFLASAAAVTLLGFPGYAAAQGDKPAAKTDLTGKWAFTVTTDLGTGTPTVTFKQQGDSVTGHYSSQTLGEVDFKGTIKDQKLSFTFRTDVQGNAVAVTYSGTVDGDAIKGTVDFAGMGGGSFTAKRRPSGG